MQERTCCDLRLTATHVESRATQQKAQETITSATTCLGPADLGEFLRKFATWAKAQPLKKPTAFHELNEAESQGVTIVG